MRRFIPLTVAALVSGLLAPGLLAQPARAQDQPDIGAALRAHRWDLAAAGAAALPDPVARKLVDFIRMQVPGAATDSEITEFLAQSPDWPATDPLLHRRDAALATDPDDGVARAACDRLAPTSPPALLRCGEVWPGARGLDAIRAAWRAGLDDAAAEPRALAAGRFTADDQWQHLTHLPATDRPAFTRALALLDAAHQPAGAALRALRDNDPAGIDLAAALPASLRADPVLTLERARALRRAGRDDEAAALWHAITATDQPAGFWTERNLLARALLTDNQNAAAYDVAAHHGQTNIEAALDAEFLAGWIALRRLDDPAGAARHFRTLAGLSDSVLTQGRAWYWLWRAQAAAGHAREAEAARVRAADWPMSFYGQIAAGDAATARIAGLTDPVWSDAAARAFAGHEVARAAAILISWGETDRARPFMLRLEDTAASPAERAMAAWLAMRLGQTDSAVALARRAGRYGTSLPELGWPRPYAVPPGTIEPAFAWAIMRQESNFGPTAISRSGARGLMQLMPATASQVARLSGLPSRVAPAQLFDPDFNIRLGTTYLAGLLDRFDGSIVLATAAYNAGPGRVSQFIARNGDPRGTDAARLIDWIEMIPLDETRNYVQRVVENLVIYRARTGERAGNPILHPDAGAARGIALGGAAAQ